MLYDAMRVLLVDEGPLENLYSSRLPPEQTAPEDTAFIKQGGGNPQRYLGSTPVMDGPAGVMRRSGEFCGTVTNVQFQVRSEAPEAVHEDVARFHP